MAEFSQPSIGSKPRRVITSITFPSESDYFVWEGTVSSTTSAHIDVVSNLGREATDGYIANDSDKDIIISINGCSNFTLKPNEIFDLTDGVVILKVSLIEIYGTDTNPQNVRVFVV